MSHKLPSRIFSHAAAGLLAAALLSGCAGAPPAYIPPQEPAMYRSLVPPGAQVDGETTAEMVSGFRRNNGLGPVTLDPALSRIALEHSRAMARKGQVSHNSGDGPLDARARSQGYRYTRIAENVAGGYHTLAEAFSGWRESSGHRKNMLMPSATRIGIAVAQAPGHKYKVFWTMVVAEPDTGTGGPAVWGAPPPAGVAALLPSR
ncbi:CAP domain-containing protein [Terrihabitans rhizophilus]|uniref:CAP domain-containing protein n=1 Tax=Terrihabitans rhizophilus TaxID=3092662 RepID=A0ABU4RNT0_9HYPH|nr:CAP domain-containing protein [Terrihabitans sp. PJ23]MDX6806497.1 CAP domain-containing protein [Terrihabitans sp. PJ23]